MSLIRLPDGYEGRLPSIAESDEDLAPIEITLWKCRRQVLATVILSLGVFSLGSVFGWSAIGIALLEEENIIKFDESLMASLFMAGGLFSGPVAAYLMVKLGRKYAMLCNAIILTIGWTVIPLANFVKDNNHVAVTMLYIGRFATGFASAGCFTIVPIYVGELADNRIHSRMESVVQLFMVLGTFYVLALGTFLDWFWISIACLIIPPVLTLLIFWLPKSPQTMQAEGREEEAKKAFYWLHTGFTEEERERLLKQMRIAVQLLSATRAMRLSERKRARERKVLKITSRPIFHPLLVSIILIFLQQASGANLTTTYIIDIFEKGGLTIDPKIGGAFLGFIYVIFYGVVGLLVDRIGRKPLLIISSFTNGLMLAGLGFYFWFAVHEGGDSYIRDNFGWVPLLLGVIIYIAYAIGVGPIAWIVVSEINHPDWREIAGSIASTTYWLTAFCCTMIIPHLRDAFDYHWTFWLHACISCINMLFIYLEVFETFGKSKQEIMAHYKGQMYNPDDENGLGENTQSFGSIAAKNSRKTRRYTTDSGSIHSGSSDDIVHVVFPDGERHSRHKGDSVFARSQKSTYYSYK